MGWMTTLRAYAARKLSPTGSPGDAGYTPASATPTPPPVPAPTPPAAPRPPVSRSWFPNPPTPSPTAQKWTEQKENAKQYLIKQLESGPAGWVSDHFEETWQNIGWKYVAVDARATRVAAADACVYQQSPGVRGEKGRKEVRPDHPLVQLLDKPNRKYGRRGMLYRIEQQLRLTGTALVWKVRDQGFNLPRQLWVLPTCLARPQPPSPEYTEGSYLVSTVTLSQWTSFGAGFWNHPSGAPIVIDARDICKISYPHPACEADGQSPVSATGQAIDINRATEEALWNVMEQGIMPSGILTIDSGLAFDQSTADALATNIQEKFGGSRNAGKIVPAQGADFVKTTLSPTEIIPEDLRNQNRDNVMAADGVPAVAAGITEASAYSGLFAGLQQFDTNVISPELDWIGDGLTIGLAVDFGDDLLVVLKGKPLNDPELKLKTIGDKVTSGAYTVDEIRAFHGDPPHPDPAKGKETAGAAAAPAPGMPGDPAGNPLAALAKHGAAAAEDDDAAGGMDADEGGPNVPTPARKAAPVESLNRLRSKGLYLPAGCWNGHASQYARG